MFELIVISAPFTVPNEAKIVNELFENGLQTFHGRSPFVDHKSQLTFLSKIKRKYLNNIVIHQHFEAAEVYDIKGINFKENHRNLFQQGDPDYTKWVHRKQEDPNFHLSASLHELEEVIALEDSHYDYVFISPIFDSISKGSHFSQFNLNALQRTLSHTNQKVVALGGINPENIAALKEIPFFGIATLGYIWKSEDPVKAFLALQKVCNTVLC